MTSSSNDPIFAAIEAHRAARTLHLAAIKEADRAERIGKFTDIVEEPNNVENAAFDAVLRAVPVTIEGLAAKLSYLRSIADSNEAWMITEHDSGALLLIDSVIASLRILIPEGSR
jgi:hypothetical protein